MAETAPPTPPLLALRRVVKSFGAVRALRGVDFEVRGGEVHALLGENGAGKSTLIKIATGAHQPDGGTIELAGRATGALDPAAARALGIACIYQQPALFPDLSVAENIGLRLEGTAVWRRVNWRARRARAVELLARVGAEIAPDTEVRALSMPEQQLVEIACALGGGARVVIMDEPTASLTQREQEKLFGIVRDLRAAGVGVIYISHRLEEIFALADRVTVLRDGESVGTHAVGDIDEARLIRLMVGREIGQLYPETGTGSEGAFVAGNPAPAAVALALRRVGCAAGGVSEVSFEVRAGEVFGLAGLVGAGRTELARVLFGLTPADAGAIDVQGRSVKLRSPRDAMDCGIAYVPEDRRRHGVILELPIAQNMTLALHRRIFRGGWLRSGAERRLADDFMGRLAIKAAGPAAPAASLSGGNQQKVALARWLATEPKILILDEPTQGVDVGAKSEIHRLVRQLADAGLAVVMISSDLPEVIGVSDRIGVMRGGRLTAVLPGKASAETVMAAALGREAAGMKHFREWSVAAVLGAVLLVLAVFAPAFYQGQPLLSLATREAPLLVIAGGMALVILCRQIDISVGSQFALCSVGAGLLAAQHWPLAFVAAAAIGLGALLGAFNGLLVAGLRLPSIVVTLATMVSWREGAAVVARGQFVDLPDNFQWLGLSQKTGQTMLIVLALAIFAALIFALRRLAVGRFVYAVGSDEEAARLAGIPPRWVTFGVFVALGALTGLAAMMNAIQSPQVDPNSGTGLEMRAIAAAVVGGVAISGGRGNLWGVLAGSVLLACVSPALTYLHIEAYWGRAIAGAIILVAVAADGLRSRRPNR